MKKIIAITLILFGFTYNGFSQNNEESESIALKREQSMLKIEQLVNNSYKKKPSVKLKTEGRRRINKQKSNTLKKATHKIDVKNITTSKNPNKKLAIKTLISKTNGRKKIIKHDPIKPRMVDKKTKLELKNLVNKS